MICLLALVVLPMLAPLGLLLRQDSRIVAVASEDPHDSDPSELPSRVSWIERDGDPESRQRLGSGMLRIGRQDDNELCLDDTTVHRYHAVIYVSPDDEVIVANVSGTNGNGIRLNGTAVEQASLRPGDCIEVGKVRLRVGAGE